MFPLALHRERLSAAERLRVVVLGYIVRGPLGGMAWHHLQYVLGLHLMGHDVLFVEDSDDYPSCYDPERNAVGDDPAYGLRFARDAFAMLGLGDAWAYFDAHRQAWRGPAGHRVHDGLASADLLLNVSGVNPLREWLREIPRRALIDTDPVFTQIRHLQDAEARGRAAEHNHFFSFGENIGRASCRIPDDGFRWLPTRQPIVLDAWPPAAAPPARGRFTTVMQWESYPPQCHEGIAYGLKRESFAPYIDLPQTAPAELEIALGSPGAPRAELAACGWHVADPLAVTRTPSRYQEYLRNSLGEFSVAKHGYVVARSGWFSERTACYLACGKPAVVQDTGFSADLPTGAGLHAFSTPVEAEAALHAVMGDYARQCRHGRDIVHAHFDARTVLDHLLRRVLNAKC